MFYRTFRLSVPYMNLYVLYCFDRCPIWITYSFNSFRIVTGMLISITYTSFVRFIINTLTWLALYLPSYRYNIDNFDHWCPYDLSMILYRTFVYRFRISNNVLYCFDVYPIIIRFSIIPSVSLQYYIDTLIICTLYYRLRVEVLLMIVSYFLSDVVSYFPSIGSVYQPICIILFHSLSNLTYVFR